jgi:hypothetical protein
VSACRACGEENPERARFCLACGTTLEKVLHAEERKVVSVLFVDLVGFTASDRDALLSHLREHERLTEPADGEDHTDSGLLHDALLRPVEYEPAAPAGDQSVWIANISRTGVLESGELLIETPLQIDALGLRRHRATDDLEQLIPRVVAEFADETPGVELIDVAAERIG